MFTYVLYIMMIFLLSEYYTSTNARAHSMHARGKKRSFLIRFFPWICVWGCFWTRHRRTLEMFAAFLLEYKKLLEHSDFPVGLWAVASFLFFMTFFSLFITENHNYFQFYKNSTVLSLQERKSSSIKP